MRLNKQIVYSWFTHYLIPIVLFFIVTVVASYYARYFVDPHHEGAIFKPALDVSKGLICYRDSFSQYGPLPTLLAAIGIELFGPYLFVVHIVTALFYGLVGVMLYLLSEKFIPKFLAVLVVILWLGVAGYIGNAFLPWSSVYALFFQLLSVFFLIKYLEDKKSYPWLFLAGFIAALSLMCRLPAGVFQMAAMVFFLLCIEIRPSLNIHSLIRSTLLLSTGFVAGATPFIIWFSINGALNDWYLQNIKFGTFFISEFGSKFDISYLFPFGAAGKYQSGSFLYGILPTLNIVALLFLVWKILRNKALSVSEYAVLSVAMIAIGSWSQYFPIPDTDFHAYWAAAPMMPVVAWLIWSITQAFLSKVNIVFHNRIGFKLTVSIASVFLISLYWTRLDQVLTTALSPAKQHWVQVNDPIQLKGMLLAPDVAEGYTEVNSALAAYISAHPNAPIISASYENFVGTFNENTINFHPLTVEWSNHYPFMLSLYPDYNERFNDYLEKNKPLIIARKSLNIPAGYIELKAYSLFYWGEHIKLLAPSDQ